MAIRITSVFGLRSFADEIGCADSIEVTGYIWIATRLGQPNDLCQPK
jgi:hypothetical protein